MRLSTRQCATLFMVLVGTVGSGSVCAGQPSRSIIRTRSDIWVLLIGVDRYDSDDVTNLIYSSKDAEDLMSTFSLRGGVPREQIHLIADTSSPTLRPTKDTIVSKVGEFLRRVPRGDTVIVSFSGHGFRQNGRTYLAPNDCQADALAATSIGIAWLRSALKSCPAAAKILLLDACHSGGAKGGKLGLTGDDLKRELSTAEGVYTIASCRLREQSFEWHEKRQGLFTYWINLGLRSGDEYAIRVANRTKELVCVRLFIDGKNILGMKRELPEQARCWMFPAGTSLAIDSWHRSTAPSDGTRQEFGGGRFQVAELPPGQLARHKFGDQLGQITAIFYSAVPARGFLYTKEGRERHKVYPVPPKGIRPGDFLAAVTIHYVHEDSFRKTE